MRLAFLADVNVSPLTVEALRGRGWDVVRVTELLPATTADSEILAFARRQDRIVITQDLDFSALVALNRWRQPSLVTLRLSFTDPEKVTARLATVIPALESELLNGCAVTIEDIHVRVRALPIS